MIVAVAASPSVDVTYVLDTLTHGEIHRPHQVVRLAGGKGINVARAVRRLHVDVTAVGIVGGATGQWIVHSLSQEGIPFTPVLGAGETRTCVSVADTDTCSVTEFYPEATPVAAGEWSALEKTTAAVLARRRPRWLSVSGAFPAGVPSDALDSLVHLGHDAGARVAVDTHGPTLDRALKSGVDLVKVNRAEAAELLGGTDAEDPVALCRGLAARGSTGVHVVVTAGADGAYALFAGEPPRHTVPPVRGAYPTGSGDSFLAGLVVALASGRDATEALRLATVAAVANSRVPGAGQLDAGTLAGSMTWSDPA